MDSFKDPETPQPITGDEPDDATQTDDAGEIVIFDRATGKVHFGPTDRRTSRQSKEPDLDVLKP